jgi:hypothetical protein
MSDSEKILVDSDSMSDSLPDCFPMDTGTSMVLILGETGAGKSYFVKKLTANAQVRVGHNLDSCMSIHHSDGLPTYLYTLQVLRSHRSTRLKLVELASSS